MPVPIPSSFSVENFEGTIEADTTTDLSYVDVGTLRMTATYGPVTVDSFGVEPNDYKIIQFDAGITLTHSTSLQLNDGVDKTTLEDDVGIFVSDNYGNWKEIHWQDKDWLPWDWATQAEAEAGVLDDVLMSPLRTKQSIFANVPPTPEVALVALTSGDITGSVTYLDIDLMYYSYYRGIVIVLTSVLPANNNVGLGMRFSIDGGQNFLSTNVYDWAVQALMQSSGGTDQSDGAGNQSQIYLASVTSNSVSNATTGGGSWVVEIYDHTNAAKYAKMFCRGTYRNSNQDSVNVVGSGVLKTASEVDAVRFLWESGNFAAASPGSYAVYGMV